MIHAELERLANHLDVVTRLCDAAGLAVPHARFGWHKESIMRLVSGLCGNRFGRSVVRVGGVAAEPRLQPVEVVEQLAVITRRIHSDRNALMVDATFLDRLRGTGHWIRGWRLRMAHWARWGAAPVSMMTRAAGSTTATRSFRWSTARRSTTTVTHWPGCGCGGRKSTPRSS